VNSFWTLVVEVFAVIASIVAILDYLGIKPGRSWSLPLGRRVKLTAMLMLMALSLGLSGRSFYLARHPRIVGKIVDRPVSAPCPIATSVPKNDGRGLPKTSHKTLAPQASVTGNVTGKNAQVGSITQGSGSIAQVGGENNSATVNNLTTRPDPAIHWTQEPFAASASETRPGVRITIWTEGPMDLPAFLAKCDRPCGNVDADTDGMSQAGYFSGGGRGSLNIVGFQFLAPTTILANTKIRWKLRSKDKDPITVMTLERFPPEKVPPNNGQTFQPE
jgi:hypothetical protein